MGDHLVRIRRSARCNFQAQLAKFQGVELVEPVWFATKVVRRPESQKLKKHLPKTV